MPDKILSLTVGNETLAATQTGETKPNILFVHGAGGGNRARMSYLADGLAALGHSSFRYDHAGHGDSTGDITTSSLNQKLAEAKAMLAHVAQPLTIIGSSMGGHVATRLTEHADVRNLVLMVPAAYGAHAEALPFTDEFRTAIRQPNSWAQSPLWPLLQKFKGNLLLVTTGQDETIPDGVLRNYWHHSPNAARRIHLHYNEAPHAIQAWLSKFPSQQPPLFQALKSILTS